MTSLLIIIALVLAVIVLAYRYGVKAKQLDQAKNAIKTYERYQNINSKPGVDNPFERMRED